MIDDRAVGDVDVDIWMCGDADREGGILDVDGGYV